MIPLSFVPSLEKRKAADLLILPFWKEKKEAKPACKMKDFSALFSLPLKLQDFTGSEGECQLLYQKKQRVLLLGLGEQKECNAESFRRSYAAAAKLCSKKKIKNVGVAIPTDGCAVSALEGMLLANYAYDNLRQEQSSLIQKICLIGIDDKTFQACKKTARIIDSVHFVRDLVNGNPDDVTPEVLADVARGLAKEFSTIKTTIFDKKRIEKEKMGLLLAVNRASELEPRFILVEYRGNPDSSDLTAIVGKGITYDTGGLILKPKGGGMETMKDDMSGAGAVLGTIRAAAALRLKVNIIGAIPSTENCIGPKSYKPGNVYKSYSGKTVEIYDTDAEGRLVLADALAYVQDQYSPTRIIDLATLTGGIVVALGEEVSGLFSNDEELAQGLIDAGEKTYERLWRMPLHAEYKEMLRSSIADIKNATPDRKASPIKGAIFLHQFIKKVPWAHLDIAGTAFLGAPRWYHTTHATGIGVRLLIEFLTHGI